MFGRRIYGVVFGLALLWSTFLAVLISEPGYTDAYYYFNAGQRLAQGDGLTDVALWVYINAPDGLPGPSHTYWMPLESLVAAGSMLLFGTKFGAAQIPSVVCFTGTITMTYGVGRALGANFRRAAQASILVAFSGFFTPFWTTTDTFALYGLIGAAALTAIGFGKLKNAWRWYALAGALSALGHLARADGVLLLVVLLLVVWWPRPASAVKRRAVLSLVAVLAYFIVMSPWLARNMSEIGSPLPAGGTQTIWLRGYNELVNYPPGANMGDFLDWGYGNILRSRWEAFVTNLGTFVAVETWVILGPFVLAALWRQRQDPFWQAIIWYAIGLHLAMTLVFAYPGYRGGLFHSSAALLPFWAMLGVDGLDDGIMWLARRRRWNIAQAKGVFGGALIVLAVSISIGALAARIPNWDENREYYRVLADMLPEDSVVMINDPPALYYHTGLHGVVVPNSMPDVVLEIAEQYGVTHLVLDANYTEPFKGLFLGDEERPFLRLLRHETAGTIEVNDDWRVFEVLRSEHAP